MARYRKKPVEIEARQLTPTSADALAQWCGGLVITEIDPLDPEVTYVGMNIPTLEGKMRASQGDYIIKGIQGEFYPCKPEIFEATYEAI